MWFKRREAGTVGPVHRFVVARATTADDLVAEIMVEFTVRADAGVLSEECDAHVLNAVEDALRHAIALARVDSLPTVGDVPDWFALIELPGVTLEHAVVSASDVWVTPALRRLFTAGVAGNGPGPWT